jgi:hypothetical protein
MDTREISENAHPGLFGAEKGNSGLPENGGSSSWMICSAKAASVIFVTEER